MRPAVFLDRDGTLIEQVHYLSDPSKVRLLPGAGASVRTLRRHGYACIVVSNQSGIGRGLFTVDDMLAVHEELVRQLAEHDAILDGWYYSPKPPRSSHRTEVEHHERKPGPGMLLRAARELSLDLSRSWMVGDMISDVLAGRNAGCRGSLLVQTGHGKEQPHGHAAVDCVAHTLADAVRMILAQDAIRSRNAGSTSVGVISRSPRQ